MDKTYKRYLTREDHMNQMLTKGLVDFQPDVMPQISTMDPENLGVNHTGSLGLFGQTTLLFKKNFLSKKRQDTKKLLGEILLPVFYLLILCYLVKLEKIKTFPAVTKPTETPQDVLSSFTTSYSVKIDVAPNTPAVKNFTKHMTSIWRRYNNAANSNKPVTVLEFNFHSSESDLVDYYDSTNPSLVEMGLILPMEFDLGSIDSTMANLNYTVRSVPDYTNSLPSLSTKSTGLDTCRANPDGASVFPRLEPPTSCPVNSYYYANFLALQSLVDQTFLELATGEEVNMTLTMENYPKAKYTAGLSTFLRVLIPLYTVIPLAQLINNLLVLIVTEKEGKIKDGLRMVGVSDMAYWMSWFGVYSIIVTIYAIMFTCVMHFMNVLANINPFILFLIFMLFGLSVITFAFALTPFFHKPKTAGVVGTLVMQFTSFLFLLQTFLIGSSNLVLILLRLISSLAFTTAIDEACAFEYIGGVNWSDLVIGGKAEGILFSLIFLSFDIVFYLVLAIYLDNVIPNEFGVRKHPLFCFKPSFWCGKKADLPQSQSFTNDYFDDLQVEQNENEEAVPQNLVGKEAIRVRHIRKTYYPSFFGKDSVEAVKGISMNIYEGQITAILGRNGAGKSTLFNMLIGLVSPTSGSSRVFGLDISDSYDMTKLRKMTGICLQHDLHFEALTVDEHLEFYGKLRGLSGDRLKHEIESILKDLRLTERRNVKALKLSGGEKRKLSVGISLIGDPKIILLDEPTAAMDPLSRRHLWSLLQNKKHGKVILLTTHFMDEADILADRKAIIHDGVIKCIGSSLYLKSRFGVGYYLTLELKDRNTPTAICDSLIQQYIPSALSSKKLVANEVKYSLPHAQVANFPPLFAEFEDHIEKRLGTIQSYGVSMTTLEEVFLQISTDLDVTTTSNEPDGSDNNVAPNEADSEEQNLIGDFGVVVRSPPSVLFAICKLRILRILRTPSAFFFMTIVPIILVAAGLAIVKSQSSTFQQAALNFSRSDELYSKSELNIAVHGNDRELSSFLTESGCTVHNFDGKFSSLLNLNQPIGTIAAIILGNEESNKDIENYVDFYDANVKRNSLNARVMINGTFLHSPPIITSLLSRFFELKYLNRSTTGLSVISKPFLTKTPRTFDQTTFYAVFLLGPAFVFVAIGMVMEIVYDREIKARNLLRVNGLSFSQYFSSVFIVYGTLSLLVTVLQISLLQVFGVKAFVNPYGFTVTTVLLILFILPCMLFSAFFSYLFDKMETAQTIFSQVASWTGTIASIVIIILDAVNAGGRAVMITHGVFCAINVFYIPFGVFYFVNKQYFVCTIMDTCEDLSWDNYNGTEFWIMFIAMVVQIPVFAALLVIADVVKDGGKFSEALALLMKRRGNSAVSNSGPISPRRMSMSLPIADDEDVVRERDRVNDVFDGTFVGGENCVVAVQNLRKKYPVKIQQDAANKKKKETMKNVVDGVDFLVEQGEVFGLLGHNGAGKTTVLKIITAEETCDTGKVQLCGYDISSNVSAAFEQLGYCPQSDILWENITLREHLLLYSAIRGISNTNRTRLVDHFLNGLRIKEHADKKARELSGGTKRKLSYAMSMLGSPRAVFLDEPSTGMDPQSKRFLWNTILGTFKDSRGALLTTHSMEEADVLCSRIAIMVKGSIICIGSPQHLKSKYGSGFTLEVKLKIANGEADLESSDELRNGNLVMGGSTSRRNSVTHGNFTFTYIKDHFPESRLTESFGNRAVFSVPKRDVKSISKTFTLLEKLKAQEDIEEYAFSQTTLEQVFLTFAKENEEEEDAS